MRSSQITRRRFITTSALAAAAVAGGHPVQAADTGKPGVRWPIGCYNRPWGKFSYDDALDGMAAAGYKLTGLLGRHTGESLLAASATEEYLAALKKRIQARGLVANMTALYVHPENEFPAARDDVRRQIDHAHALELKYALTFGTDKPSDYETYFRVMADAAAYAAERGVQIVLKPHGGSSGASDDVLRCLQKVNHPNFRVWFDAGNIIYYTGKDPVAELEPIARFVTGFCAKDCARPKGDVMIQFGDGKVDFTAVFRVLKAAGFNGPVMVECCAGQTREELTDNARANREFLEQVFKAI